jgi:protein-tyrosine-phosphatase
MAEGFARTYGSDILTVESAGLAPAPIVQGLTFEVMAERNIDLSGHFPKEIDQFNLSEFDLIVNMSGQAFPVLGPFEVRPWYAPDPIGQPREVYVRVRDQIEKLVMALIMELRRTRETGARPEATPKPRVSNSAAPIAADSRRYGFGRIRRKRE